MKNKICDECGQEIKGYAYCSYIKNEIMDTFCNYDCYCDYYDGDPLDD